MECWDTTWPTISFCIDGDPSHHHIGRKFLDGIHHTSWLLERSGPCSMRYKSVLWWASFQYLRHLSMLYLISLYISWYMLGHYSFFTASPWWLTLFPSKWYSLGMGFILGTPLKIHHTISNHTYHFPSLFPPILLSLGIFRVYWPKKGLSLIIWEEGVEGPEGWCWVKDKTLI